MKDFRFRLQVLIMAMLLPLAVAAQTNIRFVKPANADGTGGKNANDGKSWTTAKADIQDAINDLVNNNLTGEVWVAAGTYYPTESTQSSPSQYYKAFKIPEGITVRGGFAGSETSASARNVTADPNFGAAGKSGKLDGEEAKSGVYTNKTILSGNVTGKDARLEWDPKKNQFATTFYGNSYHVVFFAMNGFDANGRANALRKPAKLEGCVIEGGHAYNTDANADHPHTAYGGGIYMVANSFVYNCEVRNCDASRNGGGIYMDGGGIVRRTYVHKCQALGLGTEFGMGGGICEDGNTGNNSKQNPIVVAQSVVSNCAGRMGGGMALLADKAEGNNKYSIVANSTIVNNNSAQVEAGGVYTQSGGGLASMTIVRNKCYGSGITQSGIVTGRSGGVYSRDNAYIGNTVIWGNVCEANNDIQFASSHTHLNSTEKSKFYHNAVSKSDNTDWSTAEKMNVISLADENSTEASKSAKGFVLFKNPTTNAGNIDETLLASVNWTVSSESSLTNAGINTADLDSEGLTPAPTGKSFDMQFGVFNARPTIGALVTEIGDVKPATNVTYDGKTYDYAFYVDPEFIYAKNNEGDNGENWQTPARFLGNILDFIVNPRPAKGESVAPNFSGKSIAIFVKEGTVDNTRSENGDYQRVRTTPLDIPSNVTLIGSFATNLENSDLSSRNPMLTPTVITAKLMNRYEYNVAHLLNIDGKANITVDGFKLTFANAESNKLDNNNFDGAAITVKKSSNIAFKNIIVSNCQAKRGAAVYADKSTIKFENCIFHNNTSSMVDNSGIIYAINESDLKFDHCNMLRSVGHASYLDGTTKNHWTNSMFYGNLSERQDNTNNCDLYSILAFEGVGASNGNLTGSYNMFDRKSYAAYNATLGQGIPAESTYNQAIVYNEGVSDDLKGREIHYGLNYIYQSGTANGYPRMVNPTKNAGYSEEGDVTYYGRATSFEPHNDNPVVNAATTNNVKHESSTPSNVWGSDLTLAFRDYGGLPDIGAVESRYVPEGTGNENANPDGQPEYGRAMYVRDYRTSAGAVDYAAGGTGMSWQYAINGNAYYYPDGSHSAATSKEVEYEKEVEKTEYSENGTTTIPNGTTGVLMKTGNSYLCYTDGGLTTTTKVADATMFRITATTGGYRIRALDAQNNETRIGYNQGNLAIGTNSTWTLEGNTSAAAFKYTYTSGKQTRTRYLGTTGISQGSVIWTFYNRKSTKTKTTETVTETVNGINGLQYAVNSRREDYEAQGSAGNKDVYVGAGTYTNSTAADANSVSQPYAYMMKEGVNVYGGFPATGNPGMDQREPKQFETILQAQTQSPYVKYSRPTVGGGSYHVTVSNWGSCATSNNGSEKTSVGRVLVQPDNFSVKTSWDGFTMRYGYLMTAHMDKIGAKLTSTTDGEGLNPGEVIKAGGAGVLLQENGTLTNCVVKENLILCSPRNNQMIVSGKTTEVDGNNLYTYHMAGAGIMMTGTLDSKGLCNGKGAVVENCVVTDNQIVTKSQNTKPDNIWEYGAGIFQNGGQVYNTIINDNDLFTVQGGAGRYEASGKGTQYTNEMLLGGVFIASGNFYNNTVVNNIATSLYSAHNNHCTFSGVHVFDAAYIYNSIISDNLSRWFYSGGTSPGNGVPVSAFMDGASGRESRDDSKVHVKYSFVNVNVGETNGDDKSLVDLVSRNDTQNTNIYFNKVQGSGTKTAAISTDAAKAAFTSTIYNKTATGEGRYHLTATSPAFNAGTTTIAGVDIPDYDAEYTERIKDCRIDMGAYEYNGAADVAPYTAGVSNQAVFYVTPEGYGHMTASDPANAACAAKLQIVLDAAGRYKLENPTKQVIVKVANSYDLAQAEENGTDDKSHFTYYATRTTDQTSTDTRMWSIMIPRGVEVWGGYTDKNANGHNWTNSENGFAERNITKNATYFDSYFYNKDMKINATTYHVVTFTERVYDKDGKPYLATDYNASTKKLAATSSYNGTQRDEALFLHMNQVVSGNVMAQKVDGKTVSNRAVLDGIFVTGGNADGKSIAGSTNLNANGYGGAAIVTDYAYVRNCIVMDNNATNGGGLALTDRALVSGSLIIENNADNMGGGLYVFENGATLSNGIHVNSTAPAGQAMDYNMAHVFTSTIAANTAKQGGGIWYTSDLNPNARFNSVAVWQNEATDQQNVFGMINPEQDYDDETMTEVFFPFAYSSIQNVRASGTNNVSVDPINDRGVRFVDENSDLGKAIVNQKDIAEQGEGEDPADRVAHIQYYGLTTYSTLINAGMPVSMYNQLKDAIAISDVDILNVNRTEPAADATRSFIEAGARALPKSFDNSQLMLRLFVAKPNDVNMEDAKKIMKAPAGLTGINQYYAQEGSSFAYPFNSVEDALEYIRTWRNKAGSDAANLPFEILVGKGIWYPKKNLNGGTENIWSATYAIPEGVTIIGGFNPQGGGDTYYGRYYEPAKDTDGKTTLASKMTDGGATATTAKYLTANVKPIPTTKYTPEAGQKEIGRGYECGTETATINGVTLNIQMWHLQDIADRRAMNDNNTNGIIEPWEFANQTIFSGNAINNEKDGVYHIMTAVADEDAVGKMPKASLVPTGFTEDGYHVKEQGQPITLNGIIVTGGNALTYLATALDDYGSYIFYQGAGLQVDGNRYKNNKNNGGTGAAVFHNSAAYGVGYRDIPVNIVNCQFRNNIAGYGGAISSNGSLAIYGSSFEQNLAIAQTEKPKDGQTWTSHVGGGNYTIDKVMYPGQGGAILATRQLSAFNTLFANNEARLGDNESMTLDMVKHPTFRVPVENNASPTLRAAGGAVMMGSAAEHHIVNCNFVRNKANMYPAVFTMNPTKALTGSDIDTHNYSQIINTVAWGNEVSEAALNEAKKDATKYASFPFASRLMVNVGETNRTGAYSPAFTEAAAPKDQDALDGTSYATRKWMEANWFCAYEDGVGFTPDNKNDLRTAINYAPTKYAPKMIMDANNNVYQNCNVLIDSENMNLAGPNFGNPSVKAGYDGFMEGADWSPSRFNRLTDNANGWIAQSVDKKTYDVEFLNKKDETETYQGAYTVTHYLDQFPDYANYLALGTEKYMQSTSEYEKAADGETITINGTPVTARKNLPRISYDPTVNAQKAYIDIGVYEYIKPAFLLPGGEVDILWVSTTEHPENGAANGATWKTPTSDLQRAIETLLSSRNGHKKEIRIMEGEYSPVQPKTVNGTKYNAFVIDTKSLNESVITPSEFTAAGSSKLSKDYYAQSLTIKGGYSSTIEFEYNPAQYKTVIRQEDGTNGANTDHLIYVADPTQRYAYRDKADGQTGYDSNNNDGAWYDTSDAGKKTKTMPIQIDGVTLINDKAAATADGAAIYYPPLTDATITEATQISVGGKVVYYKDQDEFDKKDSDGKHNGTTVNYVTDYVEVTSEGAKPIINPAKIVINKTQIIGSGAKSATANTGSAVYIGQYGGNALIYNTVFHSNYGNPLVANNTVNVNNTFGLNLGQVKLTGASQLHNSALWKNYGGDAQFTGVTGTALTYNSMTNAPDGATNSNTRLSDTNSDIAEGPNFVDPENSDIEARNFDIKPSMLLLNQGSKTATTGTYYDKIINEKYDYSLVSTTNVDVLNRPRFKNDIDLGAYEYQGELRDVLYVDPNKSHRDDATGENWDKALGYGDLQNAIDLVSIQYRTEVDKKPVYVFVKGNSATSRDQNTGEELIMRNGVQVYGSIGSDYTAWHNDDAHKDGTVDQYITDMNSIREGVASNTASKTIVTGIKTDDKIDGKTVIDGFVITPVDADHQPTAPVLQLKSTPTVTGTPDPIVVRNLIVAGNDLTKVAGDVNIAEVDNGLIYEVLMRDNKPKGNGAVLKMGANGYAVNVTVEGKTLDANGSESTDDNASGTHIFNSITNLNVSTNKGISGHFYKIDDPNLNYQLTETSKYIDACDQTSENWNPQHFLPENLQSFVNYMTDRDILGNPRLLTDVTTASKIDRGAFETWKVQNNANGFLCGDNGTIGKNSSYNGADYTIIKKHFYPHDGSVVYIMENQSLVIDAPDKDHEIEPTPHNPGYMLVKEGANFYGNGRPATCSYVAYERKVPANGTMISSPFAMMYNTSNDVDTEYGVATVTKDNGELVLTKHHAQQRSRYNGEARSEWNNVFAANNSPKWEAIGEDAVTPANEGIYFLPAQGSSNDMVYRFTGKGVNMTDFVYTETGADYKAVTLKKYDDAESTNHHADYTKEEDMGWNCVGLPYLVSEYKTYADYSTGVKMMHTPKEMWLYYNGTTYPDGTTNANGDAGYYSVNSWTSADWHLAGTVTPAIWVGEGIFMQTAVFSGDEELKFFRPTPPAAFTASTGTAKGSKVERYFYDATGIKDINSSDDAVIVATEYYTSDGIRIDKPRSGNGVVIIRNIYSDGSYKTSKRSFK